MRFRAVALAAMLAATPMAADAATVRVTEVIDAPIDEVWRTIRDFGSHADWIEGRPKITLQGGSGATVGVLRQTVFADGVRFDEVLTALDDKAHVIEYDVVGAIPLPIYNVHGAIKLYPITSSNRTLVERRLDYDTPLPRPEAEAFLQTRVRVLAASLKLLAASVRK